MKNKQMLFLYNPNAGRGGIKQHLSDVLELFVKAGYEVVVYPTHSGEDTFETVRDFTYPYDIVACSGGDGTLDSVVSGMVARTERIPIGYMPAGTTNDFASSLGIPKNTLNAARQIVEGYPFACDIGLLGERTFVYVAAFGMFTDVSYETSQEVKNVIGQAAYLLEGVKRLSKVPKYHIRVSYDDQVIEDDFILGMVTNTKSVGGFRSIIGSKVVFDDGQFEVTLVRYPKKITDLPVIAGALLAQKKDEHIVQFRASEISFDAFEEISWTRDGEYGGTFEHVGVKNLNKAVRIMVDQKKLPSLSEDGTETAKR